ncbi:MAG: ABC transporter permease subunit [Acidimicrobiales bacterium]
MHEFLEFTVIGIVLGSAYAVAASGLVVTYATSGIFNIAHGAIGMVMAFVYWQLLVPWHLPAGVAFVLTVFVAAPLAGALIERLFIRRVATASVAITLVVTVGLTILLLGLVEEVIWKPTTRIVPLFFGNHGFTFLGVFVVWQDVLTIAAAVAIAVGLRLFLYRTRAGMAMRGVVDNRELIGLFGGRPTSYSTLSWSIGASLAAVAGILVAPTLQLQPLILTLLVIDAYAAAIIGRLRSLPLTFAGALLIGLASSYATYIPSSGGFWGSTPMQGLKLSVPAVLLFLALLAVPMSRIRSGAPQRRVGLPPASLVRSLQGGVLLVVAVGVAVAFLDPENVVTLGVGIAYGLVALSLVPLTGWGGQIALCQLTFAGIGAFAMAKFGHGGSVLGLLAAAGLAGAVGAVIALPALRLRGLYLALATMAFAAAMDNMFFPSAFGYNGSIPIAKPSLFGLHITTNRSFVVFLAVVFAVLSIALLVLRRGPFGRVLIAMKDSEAACATLGLSLTMTKLAVFTLSAAMAGVAGALLGAAGAVAGATEFQMFYSLLVLAVVAVGGAATCSGALLGGLVLGFLPSSVEFVAVGGAGVVLGANPEGVMPTVYGRIDRVLQPLRSGWGAGAGGDERASLGLLGERAA